MTKEYADFLAHYGVKGQKWGVRNYQNEDGSYTTAGAERYWGGGHGRQFSGSPQYQAYKQYRQPRQEPVAVQPARKSSATKEQIEARKRRAKIIIGTAAAVGVTALAVYGAKRYRSATNFRDLLRRADYRHAVNAGYSKEDAARVVRKMHTVRSSDKTLRSIKDSYKHRGPQVRPHSFDSDHASLVSARLKRRNKKLQTLKRAGRTAYTDTVTGLQSLGQYGMYRMQYAAQNSEEDKKKKKRRKGE